MVIYLVHTWDTWDSGAGLEEPDPILTGCRSFNGCSAAFDSEPLEI
jgi:hypothetical protein